MTWALLANSSFYLVKNIWLAKATIFIYSYFSSALKLYARGSFPNKSYWSTVKRSCDDNICSLLQLTEADIIRNHENTEGETGFSSVAHTLNITSFGFF